MLRKTTAAVVLAGALALGTASATSLGSFNNPLFAASSVDLLSLCNVDSLGAVPDLVDLVPDLTDISTDVGDTLNLASLDVTDLVTALTALDSTDLTCITDTLVDIAIVDGSGNLLATVTFDPDSTGGTEAVTGIVDIAEVSNLRVALRDDPAA